MNLVGDVFVAVASPAVPRSGDTAVRHDCIAIGKEGGRKEERKKKSKVTKSKEKSTLASCARNWIGSKRKSHIALQCSGSTPRATKVREDAVSSWVLYWGAQNDNFRFFW